MGRALSAHSRRLLGPLGPGCVAFVMETALVPSYDEQDSPASVALVSLASLTYCRLWPLVVHQTLSLGFVERDRQTWVKTVRDARWSRDERS
jgi:hypothetical protein